MIFHIYAAPSTTPCSWCKLAKDLLDARGQVYNYYNVTETVSKEDYAALFESRGLPMPRTVPQIFVDVGGQLNYIGGFNEMKAALKEAYGY